MKYYIVLAINKNNPSDILGMVEHSFSMGWDENRVNLMSCSSYVPTKTLTQELDDQMLRSKRERRSINISYDNALQSSNSRKELKRKINDLSSSCYFLCGNTQNQRSYRWAKHYSYFIKPPEGYFTKTFRVNSKHCPVKVDLTERLFMDKKQIKYDKFNWRNAKFKIISPFVSYISSQKVANE
jgi:hypothetical protein